MHSELIWRNGKQIVGAIVNCCPRDTVVGYSIVYDFFRRIYLVVLGDFLGNSLVGCVWLCRFGAKYDCS